MNRLRVLWRRLLRRRDAVKCFEYELRAAGPLLGRADAGVRTVAVDEIVGSVSRWQSLRADFLNRDAPVLTERHRRIAAAMQADTPLPVLQLYRLSVLQPGAGGSIAHGEYYVVDGHHRVAMAKKLGQDFLDAHVVEYRVAPDQPGQPDDAGRTVPEKDEPRAVDAADRSLKRGDDRVGS